MQDFINAPKSLISNTERKKYLNVTLQSQIS